MKAILALIGITGCLICLNGCGNRETQPEAPAETAVLREEATSEEKQETPGAPVMTEETANPQSTEKETGIQKVSELPEAFPLEFLFSSGAGAWSTVIVLNQDGSFRGEYHDSDMGSTEEGYPNGIQYICDFSGQFDNIMQMDSHTYSMTLSKITAEKEADEEWIEDGILYIASAPYGLQEGTEYLLYTPETKIDSLPDDLLSWYPGWNFVDENGNQPDTLSCYGIYNVNMGYGFFAY